MTRSRSRRRAACNAVRNATWSATLHRTCLRHIPISHRSRVTRHLPADIGHGNGWILLSDSTNQSSPPGMQRAVRNATWSATLHRTCLRHIPISHRSRVTRHLPADIGHGNGWILLSDSTNQRRAMAGYCYQILTNQSVPPMRGRV